jgi:hypothetical protein
VSRRICTVVTIALITVASQEAFADDTAQAAPKATEDSSSSKKEEKKAASDSSTTDGDGKADSVFLHVTTPEPASLTVMGEDGKVVCTAPCDKNVPASGRYRIGGARPSPTFALAPSSEGKANVKVHPGSKTEFWMGVGALGLGAGLIATGVGVLLYWNANRPAVPGGDGETTDNRYTYAMMAGTSLVILGTVAGIWGGASVINNVKTKVKGNVQEAKARPETPSRTPQLATLPRPLTVPIFGGAF